MIKILVKHFIKNYKDTKDTKVREQYGVLGGVLGINTKKERGNVSFKIKSYIKKYLS